jgi:hypothetical protein
LKFGPLSDLTEAVCLAQIFTRRHGNGDFLPDGQIGVQNGFQILPYESINRACSVVIYSTNDTCRKQCKALISGLRTSGIVKTPTVRNEIEINNPPYWA